MAQNFSPILGNNTGCAWTIKLQLYFKRRAFHLRVKGYRAFHLRVKGYHLRVKGYIFVRFYWPCILCRNCFNSLSLFTSNFFLRAVVCCFVVDCLVALRFISGCGLTAPINRFVTGPSEKRQFASWTCPGRLSHKLLHAFTYSCLKVFDGIYIGFVLKLRKQ